MILAYDIATNTLIKGINNNITKKEHDKNEAKTILTDFHNEVKKISLILNENKTINPYVSDNNIDKYNLDFNHKFLIPKYYYNKKLYYTQSIECIINDPKGETEDLLYIIKHYPDVLTKYIQDYLPIHLAIITGNLKFIRIIYNHNPNSLLTFTKGNVTSLQLAVSKGRVEAVRFILKITTELCKKQSEKGTVLHLAILDKRRDIVFELLKYSPELIHIPKISDGRYPIHLACTRDSTLVKMLLDIDNSQLDLTDYDGNLCQHFASICGSIDCLEAILSYKLTSRDREQCFKAQNNTRCTMLYMASSSGKVEMVKYLIKHCPESVNIAAAKETLPVHIASQTRHYEVVKILLEADPSTATKLRTDNVLPLNMAFKDIKNPPEIKLVRLLLSYNPSALKHRSNVDESPYQRAVQMAGPAIESTSTVNVKSKQTKTKSIIVPSTAHVIKYDELTNNYQKKGLLLVREFLSFDPTLNKQLYSSILWYFRRWPIILSTAYFVTHDKRRKIIYSASAASNINSNAMDIDSEDTSKTTIYENIFLKLRNANNDAFRLVISYC
mmetsp:Transcript_22619/g.20542  ORF Transcript_22619/g.20542 Transcript_22619/m.20542 type:complete len:556 (-) Transcript_22619:78-1745(-)